MPGLKNTVQSHLNLSHLTFQEVEKEIAGNPALILPLGGCEPYGEYGTLGTVSAVVEALATALSSKLHLLLAPTQAFGCSTPYSAFGGSAGLKARTLTNILCETIRQWYGQGFRAVIIIDGQFDNSEAVDQALRRLKNVKPEMKICAFSLSATSGSVHLSDSMFREKNTDALNTGYRHWRHLSIPAWCGNQKKIHPLQKHRIRNAIQPGGKGARTRNTTGSFSRTLLPETVPAGSMLILEKIYSILFYNYLLPRWRRCHLPAVHRKNFTKRI